MIAYRTEVELPENGTLTLTTLPFEPGENVEVIILPAKRSNIDRKNRPLKGKLRRYDKPFEPVAADDWEALK